MLKERDKRDIEDEIMELPSDKNRGCRHAGNGVGDVLFRTISPTPEILVRRPAAGNRFPTERAWRG